MAAVVLSETDELLEQVLRYLPMKEIFLARAVSRRWKGLIETSLPLKQATFRAASMKKFVTTDMRAAQAFLQQHYSVEPDLRIPPLVTADKVIINPLFRPIRAWDRLESQAIPFVVTLVWDISLYAHGRDVLRTSILTTYFLRFNIISTLANLDSSIARHMFISDPPCTALDLVAYRHEWRRKDVKVVLQDHGGIRLNHIAEALRKILLWVEEDTGSPQLYMLFTVIERPHG